MRTQEGILLIQIKEEFLKLLEHQENDKEKVGKIKNQKRNQIFTLMLHKHHRIPALQRIQPLSKTSRKTPYKESQNVWKLGR